MKKKHTQFLDIRDPKRWKSICNENNVINSNQDLSELFAQENSSLDDYLDLNESSINDEANAVEDELILESIQSVNEEKNTETIVTNSLLKEGATLISDASPENVPQQIELDSTDQI